MKGSLCVGKEGYRVMFEYVYRTRRENTRGCNKDSNFHIPRRPFLVRLGVLIALMGEVE